jgi:hypothetical protein
MPADNLLPSTLRELMTLIRENKAISRRETNMRPAVRAARVNATLFKLQRFFVDDPDERDRRAEDR